MNPAAILALIGDLYQQIADLQAQVVRLNAALAATGSQQDNPDI